MASDLRQRMSEQAKLAAQANQIRTQYRMGKLDTEQQQRDRQRAYDLEREMGIAGFGKGLADVGAKMGQRGLAWSGIRNAAEGQHLGGYMNKLGMDAMQYQGDMDALERALHKAAVDKQLQMQQLMASQAGR